MKAFKALTEKSKEKQGFTLIELLVVMAILILLASLVVPRFTGILDSSKRKADTTNKQMLKSAVELYEVNEGEEPASIDQLKEKGYVKAIPSNPVTGNYYTMEDLNE